MEFPGQLIALLLVAQWLRNLMIWSRNIGKENLDLEKNENGRIWIMKNISKNIIARRRVALAQFVLHLLSIKMKKN